MDKKIKLAVIGFAHMHITTLVKDFSSRPDAYEWIGCADVPPVVQPISKERGSRNQNITAVLEMTGMKLANDYHQVIAMKPDMALVTCENAWHAKICKEILSAGIHVVLEKPMALCYEEALSMVETAHANGVKLIVNWPTTWYAGMRTAHRLMEEGLIGRVIKFHYRNAESLGPFSYGQHMTEDEMKAEWWYRADMGGGAMADYLGYGCSIARWFLGTRAQEVMAMKESFFSQFSDVEDHGVMIIRHPGALALVEGTWATFSNGRVPSGPVIFGEKGTIVYEQEKDLTYVYTQRHPLAPDQIIPADPMPEGREKLANEVLHYFQTGELHPTLDEECNLDAVAAVDAAYRSVASGKLERC